MDIISKKKAQMLGLCKYFLGGYCKKMHIAERYTNTGACVACIALYAKGKKKKPKVRKWHRIFLKNPKHLPEVEAFAMAFNLGEPE